MKTSLVALIIVAQCVLLIVNLGEIYGLKSPPPFTQKAAMARYVVHNTNWSVVSTVSRSFGGIPYGNVESSSDGPINNSTGIPYYYISPLDFVVKDAMKHSQVTATMSLMETGYCFRKNYDPEDPRCARVTIIGNLTKVVDVKELQFSHHALFSRHPQMQYWPKDHQFAIYKINVTKVILLDFFGGASELSSAAYFAAKP